MNWSSSRPLIEPISYAGSAACGLERLHDAGVVRASEISANGAVACGAIELGHRLHRVLPGRAREPSGAQGVFG